MDQLPAMTSAMPPSNDPVIAPASTACYHCGEQVPAGADFTITIGGELRPMCCPGCRAVAELIATNGLENFYQQRTAYNQRPQKPADSPGGRYRVYDDPELAAGFTRADTQDKVTASLLLGDMTCAACTWLIEQTMGRLEGVFRQGEPAAATAGYLLRPRPSATERDLRPGRRPGVPATTFPGQQSAPADAR